MPQRSNENSGLDDQLLDHMPREAVSFFAVFSRLEYALKKSGLLRQKKDEPYPAEADWKAFAKTLGPDFLDMIQKSGRANLLLKNPPKKQMVVGGAMQWQEAKSVETVEGLFDAVGHVRNNLFHGGKFHGDLIPEVSRDAQLLSDAIWILEQSLTVNSKIANLFNEYLS